MRWPLRIVPRHALGRWPRAGIALAAIALALLLGALFLWAAGIDPVAAYAAIGRAAFWGGAYALSDTAVKATPLILCGLGCALAFRMRLWNVGAEGQLLLGAWAASGVASFWLPAATPRPLMLAAMALAALLAGGSYAALAGWLKARLNVSEILSTLMLVYVATHFNNFWIFGPWSQSGFPLTPQFPPAAQLWRLSDAAAQVPALGGIGLHAGFALALLTAAICWWSLRQTRLGLAIDAVGDNAATARSVGIDVGRTTVLVLALSGACAGLAGMVEVSGVVLRLQERFSPGYGFTAIIVAWLARLHPALVVVVALLFGGLLVGCREVQPAGIAMLLQGTLLFVVVGSEFFVRYRLRWCGWRAHE
ncbi:MAG: ABC transporter permease [Deltaproteobacteria bacterium]|nr:ABC transporter permease [Deltaproteobacteria bacterium]